ncbi:TPA: hypothetical protein AABK69_05390 [Neisseria gonorrhoeae]|uniref:Uncharacterized protein n=9 Tax=Neisseria gonorrhoeae TaxID=485 RepID=Q5F7Y4_NEIG1
MLSRKGRTRGKAAAGGGRWGRIFDLRAKPAIIPFEIKRYRLCAGLLIAFVYELAPAVLPIRGCLFF